MSAWSVLTVAVLTACASAPESPNTRPTLLDVNPATGRMASTSNAPIQFVLDFAADGVRMPDSLNVLGTERFGFDECPYPSAAGVGAFPAVAMVAPKAGGPLPSAAMGTVRVDRLGPVVGQVEVTWQVNYTCSGSQRATGGATFTVYPHGRIVRYDHVVPGSTPLSEDPSCGCGGQGRFYLSAFWTLAGGGTLVAPDGTAAGDGLQQLCAVYADHTIGLAWQQVDKTRAFMDRGVLTSVYEWLPDQVTLAVDQQTVFSAIQLSRETAAAQCGRVVADLADPKLLINGVPRDTDGSGLYSEDERFEERVELKPQADAIPRGFAVSLDVGEFAEVTRSPSIDGDWYYVQDDGDNTIFWFPDGLKPGESIAIEPR